MMLSNTMFKKSESVSGRIKIWVDTIKKISLSKKLPKNFRKLKAFVNIVEGTHKYSAYCNFYYLQSVFFKNSMNKFNYQKIYPGPNSVTINNFKTNPTILRYIRNAHNIELLFSKKIFKSSIYEIGAGYGGDCKILNDLSIIRNKQKIKRYYIFDLSKKNLLLIKLFLKKFNYNFKVAKFNNKIGNNDLLISNAALSEMNGKTLFKYINFLKKFKKGFLITNFDTNSEPYGGISLKEFLKIIKNKNPEVLASYKFNTLWDWRFGSKDSSKIVVFGHKKIDVKFSFLREIKILIKYFFCEKFLLIDIINFLIRSLYKKSF